MAACLKIGNLVFTCEQLIAAMARYRLLEQLVGEVILDSALSSIALTEEEVFQRLGGGAQPPSDFSEFISSWLQQNQVTLVYLQQVVLRDLRIEKLKLNYFDAQVESEFLRRKSEFDQVEFLRIQTSNRVLAQELYFQIRDDSVEMSQLAQQYSEGSERHTNGWIGPMKMSELPMPIQTVFATRSRKVQRPIEIDGKFWIVRLEQFYPAQLTHQVRTDLREQMYSRWAKSKTKAVMNDPDVVQVIQTPERDRQSSPSSTSLFPRWLKSLDRSSPVELPSDSSFSLEKECA